MYQVECSFNTECCVDSCYIGIIAFVYFLIELHVKKLHKPFIKRGSDNITIAHTTYIAMPDHNG